MIRSAPDLDWHRVLDRARSRALILPVRESLHYLSERFGAAIPRFVLECLDRHQCGVFERAANRAWHAAPTRRRQIWLMLERYRRQRQLPAGAARDANFWRYFRAYASMWLGLRDTRDLTPALFRALLPKAI